MDAIPSFVFLILVLAVLLVGGGLLIWLIDYTKDRGKEDSKGSEQPPAAVKPAQPRATAQTAGERELLRVSRTREGELAVFVQGQRHYHLRGLKDPQVGRETVEAIKAVLAFAEGWLPALQRDMPQPVSKKYAVDEEAFLEKMRQSDLFPLEKKPPGLLDGLARRALRRPQQALLTPADEIHELVQQRLEELPELASHSIRVATGADGGLCFYVDLKTFDAVDDIPNPRIRALVQDAIREWKEG